MYALVQVLIPYHGRAKLIIVITVAIRFNMSPGQLSIHVYIKDVE